MYGGAYSATSITLSLISFSLCYMLVNAGIDVRSLLTKVGIVTDEAGEKVSTLELAYAAHKAASPIRFSTTVALTPLVASWIGKRHPKVISNRFINIQRTAIFHVAIHLCIKVTIKITDQSL